MRESYKHTGKLKCGKKVKYFARCVFAICTHCMRVYRYICMSPFLYAARYAYSSVVHKMLKEFKMTVETWYFTEKEVNKSCLHILSGV